RRSSASAPRSRGAGRDHAGGLARRRAPRAPARAAAGQIRPRPRRTRALGSEHAPGGDAPGGPMKVDAMYPMITVSDAAAAAAFYGEVFGAVEKFRLTEPTGRLGHLELEIGDGILMIAEAYPEYGLVAPSPGDRVTSSIHLPVDDADAVVKRAVEAGARLERGPPAQAPAS